MLNTKYYHTMMSVSEKNKAGKEKKLRGECSIIRVVRKGLTKVALLYRAERGKGMS